MYSVKGDVMTRSIEGLQHFVENTTTNLYSEVHDTQKLEPKIEEVAKHSKNLRHALHEAKESKKQLIVYKFPISRINTLEHKNKNGRAYTEPLWRNVIDGQRDVWQYSTGLANHPADDEEPDWKNQMIVWIDAELDVDEGIVYGYGILVGPNGQLAQDIMDAHGRIGFSTAGYGQCDSQGLVDPDSYVIERLADLVLDPSQGVYGTIDDIVSTDGTVNGEVPSHPGETELYDDEEDYNESTEKKDMGKKLNEDVDQTLYDKVKDTIKAAIEAGTYKDVLNGNEKDKIGGVLKELITKEVPEDNDGYKDIVTQVVKDYNDARNTTGLDKIDLTADDVTKAKAEENPAENDDADKDNADKNQNTDDADKDQSTDKQAAKTDANADTGSNASADTGADNGEKSEATLPENKPNGVNVMEAEDKIDEALLGSVNEQMQNVVKEHFFEQKAETLGKMHNPSEIKPFAEQTLSYLKVSTEKSSTPRLDELKKTFEEAAKKATDDLKKIMENGTALYDKQIDKVDEIVEKAGKFDKMTSDVTTLQEQVKALKEKAQQALLERDSYKNSYFASNNTIKNLKKSLSEANLKCQQLTESVKVKASSSSTAAQRVQETFAKYKKMAEQCKKLSDLNRHLLAENAALKTKAVKYASLYKESANSYDRLNKAHTAMVESNKKFDDDVVNGHLNEARQNAEMNKMFKQDTSPAWEQAYAAYGNAILPMKESILNAKTKDEAEMQIIKFLGGYAGNV